MTSVDSPGAADVVTKLGLSPQESLDALALAEPITLDAFNSLKVAAAATRFPKAVLILSALTLARALVRSIRQKHPELFEQKP